jgi:hypothetical protein
MKMRYKGVDMEPRVMELVAGGFALEVMLWRDERSSIVVNSISTLETFDTREKAKQAGFSIGMDVVDGKIPNLDQLSLSRDATN